MVLLLRGRSALPSSSSFQVQNYVDFALHNEKPKEKTEAQTAWSLKWTGVDNATNNPGKGLSNSERSTLETTGGYMKERSVTFTIYIMSMYV